MVSLYTFFKSPVTALGAYFAYSQVFKVSITFLVVSSDTLFDNSISEIFSLDKSTIDKANLSPMYLFKAFNTSVKKDSLLFADMCFSATTNCFLANLAALRSFTATTSLLALICCRTKNKPAKNNRVGNSNSK